jgi:hypothetical protein
MCVDGTSPQRSYSNTRLVFGGTEETHGKLKLSNVFSEIWTRDIFQTKREPPCLTVGLGVGG